MTAKTKLTVFGPSGAFNSRHLLRSFLGLTVPPGRFVHPEHRDTAEYPSRKDVHAEPVSIPRDPATASREVWSPEVYGKDAYIIHYTYGQDFARSGEATPGKIGEWHFDKRDFTGFPPKTPFPMPPKDAHEVIQKMMTIINDGITELPHWP